MAGSNNILDNTPEDFNIYLGELQSEGVSQDYLDFLRKEYQAAQGAVKDPFAESNRELESAGRERAEFLPFSKPKDKSLWDSIKSGEADLAMPGAIAGGTEAAVSAINAPSNMLKGVPYTKGEVGEEAMAAAGLTAGVGSAVPVPNGALRIFGGPNARNPDTDKYQEARRLDSQGVPDEEIWRQTGWFRDPTDKKWRFEIDDSEASLLEVPQTGVDYSTTLENVLSHDKLFEQYPSLKGVEVSFSTMEDGLLGEFNPTTGAIKLNNSLPPEQARKTLLHELQHGVQMKEGFAQGANPETMARHPEVVKQANLLKSQGLSDKEVEAGLNNMKFEFYEAKSGEIEARLVEDRADMPQSLRSTYPPNLNREAVGNSRGAHAWGDVGLKPKVSDFVITEKSVEEVVSKFPSLEGFIKVPTGTKLPDGTVYEGLVFAPNSTIDKGRRMPTRGPEFRDEKGNILSIYTTTPEGKIDLYPVSDFLDTDGVKDFEEYR